MYKDLQKNLVYNAEQFVERILQHSQSINNQVVKLGEQKLILFPEKNFKSLTEVDAYVNNHVLKNIYVVAKFGLLADIPIRRRKGNSAAHFEVVNGSPGIAIPFNQGESNWANKELVILHEVAHYLIYKKTLKHDSLFVGVFCWLVGKIMGDDTGELLRNTMQQNGVKVREIH